MKTTERDVVVIGAGLSGICAAYYLKHRTPGHDFEVLEARERFGGTWDLFTYPGVRSDSDMYTLGFSFHPWDASDSFADGPAIIDYLKDTIETYQLSEHITYGARLERADWSSEQARWTLTVRRADGELERWVCKWLWGCTGYYRYDRGHTPDFPGAGDFKGRLMHPQQWDDEYDYTDKQVVVIGSGATAVTLLPKLAERAAHVTMLQRSPTYIMSMPQRDLIAEGLKRALPRRTAHSLIRWKNVLMSMGLYQFSRLMPERAKRFYLDAVHKEIGEHVDIDAHFTPTYSPWDQRLCLVPEGDLFEALRSDRASVVTDQIARIEPDGVLLQSGERLQADLIITATGLEIQVFGGAEVWLDGERVKPSESMMYRGSMLSGVPNLSISLGYTNASWTLKCELVSGYVSRLLNVMKRQGYEVATPRLEEGEVEAMPLIDLSAGYILRAEGMIPQQGSRLPWRLYQNYILDRWLLGRGAVADSSLELR